MNESFLVYAYPWLLRFLLFSAAASAFSNARALAGPLKSLPRREAALLALLILGTLVLRFCLIAPQHRVFQDEFEHANIAENIHTLGAFAESRARGPGLDILETPTWPGGHHALLSLAYGLAGTGESTAFGLSAVLGVMSVLLVFLMSLRLFSDPAAALLSAFLWAALPLRLKYSAAADLTSTSLFWIASCLLSLTLYAERRERSLYLLHLVCLLLAAHTRFENLLLIPMSAAFLARLGVRPWAEPSRLMTGLHAAFAALLLPVFLLLARNRGLALPGFTDSPSDHLRHIVAQVPGNLLFLLGSPARSLLTVAAAAGAWRASGRRQAGVKRLLFTATCFFAAYAAFFRGDFRAGAEDRYALSVLLPLVPLAGFGIASAAPRRLSRLVAALASAAFLTASWLERPAPAGDSPLEREWAFLKEEMPRLPEDSFVIAYPVPMVLAAGRPAVSPRVLLEDSAGFEKARGQRELFLFKDYWWKERKEETTELEKELRKNYRFERVTNKTTGNEPGNDSYELHRLVPSEFAPTSRAPLGR